ncbi:hypothetical protein [Brevibacillus laterosporus]|uniref:hypothetical protein n=1 Tax=Brevibacillus laterosporus TaxID=1465 RepID=UPI0018CEEC50|nr:hypothetical protein [Brevibacillus laterosporus]
MIQVGNQTEQYSKREKPYKLRICLIVADRNQVGYVPSYRACGVGLLAGEKIRIKKTAKVLV